MNRFHSTFAPVLLAALLAAPGWAETQPPSPQKAPAKKQSAPKKKNPMAQRLCDALHTLPAERKRECCGKTPPSLAELCTQALSDSISRGAVTLDATRIDQCRAEISRQLDGCDWVSPLMPPLPEVCRNVVHGVRKAGTGCRSSLECQEGLFCLGAGPQSEGICAAPMHARASCNVPADELAVTTRAENDPRHRPCEGLCIKGYCVPFSSLGGACQSSAVCTPGLHCIDGRCQDQPLPAIGEACTASSGCGIGHCQDGRCVALKGMGEACSMPSECRSLACLSNPGEAGRCSDPCGNPLGGPHR